MKLSMRHRGARRLRRSRRKLAITVNYCTERLAR
jgi:hypothetical protein